MMRLRWIRFLLAGLAIAGMIGCSTPKGRIMEDAEEDIVGTRAIGAAAWNCLVEGAVQKLLLKHSADKAGVGRLKVACMKVENKSIEELFDWQESIYQILDTSVRNSERYDMVSLRFIDSALREIRRRPDDLNIPKYRREFVKVLETQGNPINCLLFPTLTSGTTRAGDYKQRDYLLTLELLDVETGSYEKETTRIRKEYTR